MWGSSVTARLNVASPLPPLSFGNHGPSDRLLLLYFLKCLSPDWEVGTDGKGKATGNSTWATGIPGVTFCRFMHIVPKGKHVPAHFPFNITLYWTVDMGIMSLFFRPKGQGRWAQIEDFDAAGLHFQWATTDKLTLTITPLTSPPENLDTQRHAYPTTHPIHQLTTWAFDLRHRPFIEGAVLDALPHKLWRFILRRQMREHAQAEPLEYIEKQARGWTKVYLSDEPDTIMQPVQYLREPYCIHGLTQVFPWAPFMLTSGGPPNCVELDATFEMMEPYVLEVLNIIVRNESIPIAQAIFPSESEKSFHRLYKLVEMALKQNGLDPAILTKLTLVSDQGAGLISFADRHGIHQIFCHVHYIRNAGSGCVPGGWASQILKTNSPEACRETALRVKADIEELKRDHPKLYTRFCDPKAHPVIKRLMASIETAFKGTIYEVLLVDPEWNVPTTGRIMVLEDWAKWLRLGCPTTTNSEESVHRWINALQKELANAKFWTCWEATADYLARRFTERNSETRVNARGARDWIKERSLLGQKIDPAYRTFMEALYSMGGEPVQDDGKWRFPEIQDEMPEAKFFFITKVNVDKPHNQVPPGWKRGQRRVLPVGLRDLGRLEIKVPADAITLFDSVQEDGEGRTLGAIPADVNLSHHLAAWRIIHGIRRLIHDGDWGSRFCWTSLISTVFLVGPPDTGGLISPDAESQWKYGAMSALQIPIKI
jgi:hypothetical protein